MLFARTKKNIGPYVNTNSILFGLAWALFLTTCALGAETPAELHARHDQVARRRARVHVICHRGASQFAHENTLEAYRAALELGADGNEIDIRATRDGVLVCFHDDMLDSLLQLAYGDVSDHDWGVLRLFAFRNPGAFGEHCRIPTLEEVFELHRRMHGLVHLDIKQSGLDVHIAQLIDRMDLWDHVAYCNGDNGAAIVRHPKFKSCRYKAPGMWDDRSEVDPHAIARALNQPGDGLIVDDPRGVLVALKRPIGRPSLAPVNPLPAAAPGHSRQLPGVGELLAVVRDAEDWNRMAMTDVEQSESAQRIQARAKAAEMLALHRDVPSAVLQALEDRVRRRSLHKNWRYHGLDGAMALRTLIALKAPGAVAAARQALWRDDPELEPVVNPQWKNPRAWTDFRVKMVAFPALLGLPSADTEQLCRDFLALSEADARQLAPMLFGQAAKTLLTVSPKTETAVALLKDARSVVRGETILGCLAKADQAWARQALETAAPFALDYTTGSSKPLR
jgi:Glycerophosphoryl diester phosphodiesterase family